MYRFSKEVAMVCGINAAIVAEFIRDKMESDEALVYDNKRWCRCSIVMMSGYMPFFTRHMIADALGRLIEEKVIRKGSYNQNPFDNTNWYTFTDYGRLLISKNDEEDKKRPNLVEECRNVALDNDGLPNANCMSCDYYDRDKKVCSVCVKEILGEVKEKYSQLI